MSLAGGRRVGLIVLALLFLPALGLSSGPFDLGSVRLGGVSVLWWYAFGVGPVLAVVVTTVLLLRGRI